MPYYVIFFPVEHQAYGPFETEIEAKDFRSTYDRGGYTSHITQKIPQKHQLVSPSRREATEATDYYLGQDKISVEIHNSVMGFAWRIRVNEGDWAEWYSLYEGLLVHDGYAIATAYYSDALKEFVPFRISYAKEA